MCMYTSHLLCVLAQLEGQKDRTIGKTELCPFQRSMQSSNEAKARVDVNVRESFEAALGFTTVGEGAGLGAGTGTSNETGGSTTCKAGAGASATGTRKLPGVTVSIV
jgi:hypothetical protein